MLMSYFEQCVALLAHGIGLFCSWHRSLLFMSYFEQCVCITCAWRHVASLTHDMSKRDLWHEQNRPMSMTYSITYAWHEHTEVLLIYVCHTERNALLTACDWWALHTVIYQRTKLYRNFSNWTLHLVSSTVFSEKWMFHITQGNGTRLVTLTSHRRCIT